MGSSAAKENKDNKVFSPLVFLIMAVVLLILSVTSILVFGKNCSVEYRSDSLRDVSVSFDESVVDCISRRIEGDTMILDFRSVAKGNTFVEFTRPDGLGSSVRLYVHGPGIITMDNIFGRCRGDIMFPVSAVILLTAAIIWLTRRYRGSLRENLCRYTNAWLLGAIIFTSFLLAIQLFSLIRLNLSGENPSVLDVFESAVLSSRLFTSLLLPVALVISLAISISNLSLMKHEGVCLRNMLGFFLGLVLCLGTVAPFFIYPMLDRIGADVHRYSSPWVLITNLTEDAITVMMAYLECVLLGTAVSAVKAAKHVPEFNKDFILILGCQITKDGGLTKLLQSRTDRAVEFADMQKKATGKDIIFVPSGGKGDDEVIAEAEAIHNYLVSIGIPEERILVENKSVNTDQNIRFSDKLIRERMTNAKTAFSTTNYHVFRAGCIADEAGIPMEGIGAGTKRYFWINAFIREFIATLHYEKKAHIRSLLPILLCVLAAEVLVYISYLR